MASPGNISVVCSQCTPPTAMDPSQAAAATAPASSFKPAVQPPAARAPPRRRSRRGGDDDESGLKIGDEVRVLFDNRWPVVVHAEHCSRLGALLLLFTSMARSFIPA